MCLRAARASGARRRALAGTTAQKQSESPACSFSITPRESARRVPGGTACLSGGVPHGITRLCAEFCRPADVGLVGGAGKVAL